MGGMQKAETTKIEGGRKVMLSDYWFLLTAFCILLTAYRPLASWTGGVSFW